MKRLILLLFIITSISGCSLIRYPEELKLFTEVTKDRFWFLQVTKGSGVILSIVQKSPDRTMGIGLDLTINKIPEFYTDFQSKVYNVSTLTLNETQNQIKEWVKRKSLDADFEGPEFSTLKPAPEYFTSTFDNSKNTIALKKKWIKKLEKSLQVSYLDWHGYLAQYDITNSKGLMYVEEDKGELLFFISPSHNKMIESYFSNNQWDYIRYVEGGELPLNVDEDNPENIIAFIWNAWQEYILPYIKSLDLDSVG